MKHFLFIPVAHHPCTVCTLCHWAQVWHMAMYSVTVAHGILRTYLIFWGKMDALGGSMQRFLTCVCGKLQFALVAACISHTVWRTLEWKQINKHHSPTERPQTHTFSLLPLNHTPHNAVSELPLRTVISRKLWWWHSLGAERKRTVPQRKMIERERGWESERCRVRRGWKAREREKWIEWIMNKKSKGDK